MALRFIEKLNEMKRTSFKFVSFEKKVTMSDTDERKAYLVFTLDNPIDRVVGSTVLYDPMDRSADSVAIYKDDVTEVICMMDNIEKYEEEWVFDEDENGELTKTGSYHGDMFLDVSSKRGEVWLVDTKLCKFGQDKRFQARQEQYQKYFGKKD